MPRCGIAFTTAQRPIWMRRHAHVPINFHTRCSQLHRAMPARPTQAPPLMILGKCPIPRIRLKRNLARGLLNPTRPRLLEPDVTQSLKLTAFYIRHVLPEIIPRLDQEPIQRAACNLWRRFPHRTAMKIQRTLGNQIWKAQALAKWVFVTHCAAACAFLRHVHACLFRCFLHLSHTYRRGGRTAPHLQ